MGMKRKLRRLKEIVLGQAADHDSLAQQVARNCVQTGDLSQSMVRMNRRLKCVIETEQTSRGNMLQSIDVLQRRMDGHDSVARRHAKRLADVEQTVSVQDDDTKTDLAEIRKLLDEAFRKLQALEGES